MERYVEFYETIVYIDRIPAGSSEAEAGRRASVLRAGGSGIRQAENAGKRGIHRESLSGGDPKAFPGAGRKWAFGGIPFGRMRKNQM